MRRTWRLDLRWGLGGAGAGKSTPRAGPSWAQRQQTWGGGKGVQRAPQGHTPGVCRTGQARDGEVASSRDLLGRTMWGRGHGGGATGAGPVVRVEGWCPWGGV